MRNQPQIKYKYDKVICKGVSQYLFTSTKNPNMQEKSETCLKSMLQATRLLKKHILKRYNARDGIIQVWATLLSLWSAKIEIHSRIRRIRGKENKKCFFCN